MVHFVEPNKMFEVYSLHSILICSDWLDLSGGFEFDWLGLSPEALIGSFECPWISYDF